MAATTHDFPDFDVSQPSQRPRLSLMEKWFIGIYIPGQKIDHLKTFLDLISQETGKWLMPRNGSRKADYVERVVESFKDIKRRNNGPMYRKLREACEAIGKRPYHSFMPAPPPTFGGMPAGASSGSVAGPSRTTSNWASGATSVALPQRSGGYLEDWKPNPMWKPLRALTAMTMLPDISANEQQARKERKVHFQLPHDVIEKLQQTKNSPKLIPQYSVRLFCTSGDHYRQPGAYTSSTAHITNKKIPIEYPNTPDFVVDDYHLRFTERGLRGKPGSAPPVDLHRTSRGMSLVPGTLRSVVFGHTGPTTGKRKDVGKRFFFQIAFCEWIPKDELLNRLEKLAPTEPAKSLALREFLLELADVVQKDDDDDIQHGVSKMTLKDKLSYMRITTPVRSKHCAHLQCFEAKWWVEANSVHPQWLCPLCDKELAFEDMFVDGFFLEILKAVPEDFDEVVMEGDGEWHTEDNKYGSTKWMAEHGKTAPIAVAKREPSPEKPTGDSNSKGKRKAIEILSSDDEDERDVPLSRLTSTTASAPPRPQFNRPDSTTSSMNGLTAGSATGGRPSSTRSNEVIDLTLDDSDDEEEQQVSRPSLPRTPDFQIPGPGNTSRSAPLAAGGDLYLPAPHRLSPYNGSTNEVAPVARIQNSGTTSNSQFPTLTSTTILPTSTASFAVHNSADWRNPLEPNTISHVPPRPPAQTSFAERLQDRYVPPPKNVAPQDSYASRSDPLPERPKEVRPSASLADRIGGLERAVEKDSERRAERYLGTYSSKRPRVEIDEEDLSLDESWNNWFEKTRDREEDRGWKSSYRA